MKINGKEVTQEQTEQLDVASELDEAEGLLEECIQVLERVNQTFNDRNAEAYLIDQLKIRVNSDHGFLSRDLTIASWRERLVKKILEEEEDYYD